MKTLYKLDSKGKMRILKLWADGEYLMQESGLVGGKLTPNQSLCKAKNIGRSNATTAIEQAAKEVEAKYVKKLTEGYSATEEEARSDTKVFPMLAKEYSKEKHKIDWRTAFAQAKLDGMRCIIIIKDKKVSMFSRTGKPITTCPHILFSFEEMAWNLPDIILDGELYAHGLTFQENMRLTKKYRGEDSHVIKFHTYDIISEQAFPQRSKALKKYYYTHLVNKGLGNICEHVDTVGIASEEQLKSIHSLNVKNQYEGTMVRWGNDPYKQKGRSSGLLKYKDFLDIKATIIDIVPFQRRPKQGKFKCSFVDNNGKTRTFMATPKCSNKKKEYFLSDKNLFIGDEVEIRFFEYTDDGLPRFPVAIILD